MSKIKSGTFIPLAQSSQILYPGIKEAYKIKANNDWFEMTYNLMKDQGNAISPDDSYPKLTKDQSRNGWVVA
jgi:hypothetical protein